MRLRRFPGTALRSLAVLLLSSAAGPVPAGCAPGTPRAGAPVVPIGERYSAVVAWTGPDPSRLRRDFSGLAAVPALPGSPGAPHAAGLLLLVDDKPARLDSMIVGLYAGQFTGRPGGAARPLTTEPVPVPLANPLRLPVGDDIEDLAILAEPAGTDGSPAGELVAMVGERGPGDRGVSWLYLAHRSGAGLTLVDTRLASPPYESVGNDGMEGVALVRLGGDTTAVLMFKERPETVYVRTLLYRRVPTPGGAPRFDPIGEARMDRIGGLTTQASATFGPEGDLYVLDRYERRIAIVSRAGLLAALRDPADNLVAPREWLDYAALEPQLEGKVGADQPLSIFGTAEGIAFDAGGNLLLLADNNESGPSVLLVLTPRK